MNKDVLRLIASDICIRDILNLSMVCKDFAYKLGPSHKELWRLLLKRDIQPYFNGKSKKKQFKNQFILTPFEFYRAQYKHKILKYENIVIERRYVPVNSAKKTPTIIIDRTWETEKEIRLGLKKTQRETKKKQRKIVKPQIRGGGLMQLIAYCG